MIDPSIRLRRAIHLHDLSLVKRIIKNNPTLIQNPDFADNSNTSLHLAAQLGLLEIARFLIEAGHEDESVSRNGNMDTPLHLAVESKGKEGQATAELLARSFTRCIAWKNAQGSDPVMLVSRHPSTDLLNTLLALTLFPSPTTTSVPSQLQRPPTTSQPGYDLPHSHHHQHDERQHHYYTPQNYNPLTSTDSTGNTALHYASAHGELKAIRTLLEHGADPNARNDWSWTPVAYSASVQAEVYFKGLVNSAGIGLLDGTGTGAGTTASAAPTPMSLSSSGQGTIVGSAGLGGARDGVVGGSSNGTVGVGAGIGVGGGPGSMPPPSTPTPFSPPPPPPPPMQPPPPVPSIMSSPARPGSSGLPGGNTSRGRGGSGGKLIGGSGGGVRLVSNRDRDGLGIGVGGGGGGEMVSPPPPLTALEYVDGNVRRVRSEDMGGAATAAGGGGGGGGPSGRRGGVAGGSPGSGSGSGGGGGVLGVNARLRAGSGE